MINSRVKNGFFTNRKYKKGNYNLTHFKIGIEESFNALI